MSISHSFTMSSTSSLDASCSATRRIGSQCEAIIQFKSFLVRSVSSSCSRHGGVPGRESRSVVTTVREMTGPDHDHVSFTTTSSSRPEGFTRLGGSLAFTCARAGHDDTDRLLPDTDDSTPWQTVTAVLRGHWKATLLVCDVVCVLVLTALMLAGAVSRCRDVHTDQVMEWCEPWTSAVDRVLVDLNFDLLVHCDMPTSCVAYAQLLMEQKGFNYNFIVGDEELVYVGKGYGCRSDALRLQMLVTRYTWDPKLPHYRIPYEVVVRYSEILQEGVQCGKISANYTVSASCSVYGEWCGAANIEHNIPWTQPALMSQARTDRNPWWEPPHPLGHPFLAFHVDRVYDGLYKMKTCNLSRPTA